MSTRAPILSSTTNLLPAILLAGPPHSGKSVLAHLLGQHLRQAGVQHILLSAAPDGEGAWFHQTDAELRFALRQKGRFTPGLVEQMIRAVQQRALPMLVDIGGQPQGRQLEIMDACTHVVQLYRDEQDRRNWRAWIDERNLIPVAELHSYLPGPDHVQSMQGVLRGAIGNLDRDRPQPGPLFRLLLERIQGICSYDSQALEREHLRRAPDGVVVVSETQLAQRLGIARPGQSPWWEPEHLARLAEVLPARQPMALYGPGPVWLTAAVAAINAPDPLWVFDARHYGWLPPPSVVMNAARANPQLSLEVQSAGDATRLVFRLLPEHYVLKPQSIFLPPLDPAKGIILDGKLPKWLWAALARGLYRFPWLAAYNPASQRHVRFWERGAVQPAQATASWCGKRHER